jgi:hypothetical protein
LLAGYAFGAAPILLGIIGVLVVASIYAAIIALATSDADVTCYSKGIFTGGEIFAAIVSVLGTKYSTGTPDIGKLIATMAATLFLSSVVPTNTVPACL